MTERTLSIIKPDGVQKRILGEVITRLEKSGLRVAAAKMRLLTKPEAEGFYAVHRDRPFFSSLVEFMCSSPVFIMVLEGDQAILRNREIMGATDPAKAAPGTIRSDFGTNVEKNAVHGSDSLDTARWEIAYFFSPTEIC
jgi:nucleoside-diphosphate kinase